MFQQGRTLRTHCSVRDQTPETTQYESVDMKCPEQAYPERQDLWLPGAGGEGDAEIIAEGQWAQGFFLEAKMF